MNPLHRIQWRHDRHRWIGMELELFLMRAGLPVPESARFLKAIQPRDPDGRWTYELSACQVEYRTAPCPTVGALCADLERGISLGRHTAWQMDCTLDAIPYCPDVPSVVYQNDPRYARIAQSMFPEVLHAACAVTGVHIHIGCSSSEDAILVHNVLIGQLESLLRDGDLSGGKRLAQYRVVKPDFCPPGFHGVDHFGEVASANGFADNLRNCWWIVRITEHGTVEVRLYDSTTSIEQIGKWVRKLLTIVG